MVAVPAGGRVVARSSLNVVLMLRRGTRPARGEIDEAALAAAGSARRADPGHRPALRGHPRGRRGRLPARLRDPADEGPQRREEELIPWLKTVVKHEAFALRRQRDRHSPVTDDGGLGDRGTPPRSPTIRPSGSSGCARAPRRCGRLKPQEIRALRLKAEGYSYREICEITGWSYTKVNRCLTEGRQAFLRRVAGIEGGVECERFDPLLSALADGEASAEQLASLRPHMRTCLSLPRAAAGVPGDARAGGGAGAAGGAGGARGGGGLRGLLESVAGAAQQKAAAWATASTRRPSWPPARRSPRWRPRRRRWPAEAPRWTSSRNHRGPPRARNPVQKVAG